MFSQRYPTHHPVRYWSREHAAGMQACNKGRIHGVILAVIVQQELSDRTELRRTIINKRFRKRRGLLHGRDYRGGCALRAGSGFGGNEVVRITVESKSQFGLPSTTSTDTMSTAAGAISETISLFCDGKMTHNVTAVGLASAKSSKAVGTSC
jgi:hypothetical protein